jgi:hypothetical protein
VAESGDCRKSISWMGESDLSDPRRYVSSLARGTAVRSGGSEIPDSESSVLEVKTLS